MASTVGCRWSLLFRGELWTFYSKSLTRNEKVPSLEDSGLNNQIIGCALRTVLFICDGTDIKTVVKIFVGNAVVLVVNKKEVQTVRVLVAVVIIDSRTPIVAA